MAGYSASFSTSIQYFLKSPVNPRLLIELLKFLIVTLVFPSLISKIFVTGVYPPGLVFVSFKIYLPVANFGVLALPSESVVSVKVAKEESISVSLPLANLLRVKTTPSPFSETSPFKYFVIRTLFAQSEEEPELRGKGAVVRDPKPSDLSLHCVSYRFIKEPSTSI